VNMTVQRGVVIVLKTCSALTFGASIALMLAVGRRAISVEGIELFGGLIGIATIFLLSTLPFTSSRTDQTYRRWYRGCLSIALVVLGWNVVWVTSQLYWSVIGRRGVEPFEAAEAFVRDEVAANTAQGIRDYYVSIDGRDVASFVSRSVEEANPGIQILSVSLLSEMQRKKEFVNETSTILHVEGFAFPAWRVVQVEYRASGCRGTRDYFFTGRRWIRLGQGIGYWCN
jgi:hypothetical protein